MTAEVDGARLSDEELFDFLQLLLLAGTETTTNLIANAVSCLASHPEQLRYVREDHARIPAALEEVLRFRSPLQIQVRRTTEEVELHGCRIPGDRLVLAMIGSANRDETRFPHASRFDVTRAAQPHVGFGHGIHFCLGAALARLEARVAMEELLARTSALRLRTPRWPPRQALIVHGPRALDISFLPA